MPESNWVVGFHAVLGALTRDASRVELVWIDERVGGQRAQQVLSAARSQGVRFAVVPRREIDRIALGVAHNGFAARLSPAPFVPVAQLLEARPPVFLLGLDHVQDPRNLGAVVRVLAAFGLGGLVLGGPHPPPLGGAASKVAAGTLPLVALAKTGSLGDVAKKAQEHGFYVVGADARGTPLDRVNLPDRLLLCLGGEGGLRAKTRKFVDELVAIPMHPQVESLNLAVALGIFAWEWRRRWPFSS